MTTEHLLKLVPTAPSPVLKATSLSFAQLPEFKAWTGQAETSVRSPQWMAWKQKTRRLQLGVGLKQWLRFSSQMPFLLRSHSMVVSSPGLAAPSLPGDFSEALGWGHVSKKKKLWSLKDLLRTLAFLV